MSSERRPGCVTFWARGRFISFTHALDPPILQTNWPVGGSRLTSRPSSTHTPDPLILRTNWPVGWSRLTPRPSASGVGCHSHRRRGTQRSAATRREGQAQSHWRQSIKQGQPASCSSTSSRVRPGSHGHGGSITVAHGDPEWQGKGHPHVTHWGLTNQHH